MIINPRVSSIKCKRHDEWFQEYKHLMALSSYLLNDSSSNGSLKPRNEKIIESRELKRIQQAFLITYRSLMNQESIERWSYPSCSVSSLEFFLLIPQLVIYLKKSIEISYKTIETSESSMTIFYKAFNKFWNSWKLKDK